MRTQRDPATNRGGIALAIASSGIAALLLKNGRTAHSRFKIPLNITATSTCSIQLQSPLANLFRDAKLIVWDEAVMTHKDVFHCVDKTLRAVLNTNEVFGGKVVLFGGDFRQILPVVPLGGKAEIIHACFKFSYLWSDIQNFYLNQNLRVRRDEEHSAEFMQFLNLVGNGGHAPQLGNQAHNEETGEILIRIPRAILSASPDLDNFIREIYPSLDDPNAAQITNATILAPTNLSVEAINQRVLELFRPEEQARTYLSADSLSPDESEENQLNVTVEFLNSVSVPGLPPHRMNLKIGAVVILLRNLNTKKGLCNGTRLRVEAMHDNFIIARILTGRFHNETVLLPRITLHSTPQDRYPFIIQRHQFPIKLAFTMTINKSQGQTLERVGVYLKEPVFTHGQLYVALSRVTNVNAIRVFLDLGENALNLPTDQTKNIVYREVLLA